MAQNTARQIKVQPQIEHEPRTLHTKEVKTYSKRVPLSRLEVFGGVVIAGLMVMVLMITVISAKITLSKAQYNLQQVNQGIVSLQNKNVDTKQEISELSSRSRLTQIAQNLGLKMNNQNIRNVSK
nr:cell division protein FtsL [Liquorilactobacillus satsumensis]